jgi:hypothetical protein
MIRFRAESLHLRFLLNEGAKHLSFDSARCAGLAAGVCF